MQPVGAGWVRIKFVLRGSVTDAQGGVRMIKCETMRKRNNKSSFHSSKVEIQTLIEPPPKFTGILRSSHHHNGEAGAPDLVI